MTYVIDQAFYLLCLVAFVSMETHQFDIFGLKLLAGSCAGVAGGAGDAGLPPPRTPLQTEQRPQIEMKLLTC